MIQTNKKLHKIAECFLRNFEEIAEIERRFKKPKLLKEWAASPALARVGCAPVQIQPTAANFDNGRTGSRVLGAWSWDALRRVRAASPSAVDRNAAASGRTQCNTAQAGWLYHGIFWHVKRHRAGNSQSLQGSESGRPPKMQSMPKRSHKFGCGSFARRCLCQACNHPCG